MKFRMVKRISDEGDIKEFLISVGKIFGKPVVFTGGSVILLSRVYLFYCISFWL